MNKMYEGDEEKRIVKRSTLATKQKTFQRRRRRERDRRRNFVDLIGSFYLNERMGQVMKDKINVLPRPCARLEILDIVPQTELFDHALFHLDLVDEVALRADQHPRAFLRRVGIELLNPVLEARE